jgi:NAD(P)-dependent dehydrogenase (short-subunit alcohol dehydrogenase family)
LTDINSASLSSTAESLHALAKSAEPSSTLQISTLAGDISSSTFVDSLFDLLITDFGRIDYLVNCAGIAGNNARSDLTSIEAFDQINGVNYKGLWMCSRKALGIMKDQEIERREGVEEGRGQRGSIVNVASQLGLVGREDAREFMSVHLPPFR